MTDPLAWLTDLEGVRSAYAGTRDGIDVMLRDRGLRRTSPELTAESLLRGAHASAVLEGSASTLEQVREGEADEIAADAVRLSASMLALAPLLKTAPLQAIARLHAVAGSAALCAEESRDSLVLTTVSDLETLTTGMSRKIWQKISLLPDSAG